MWHPLLIAEYLISPDHSSFIESHQVCVSMPYFRNAIYTNEYLCVLCAIICLVSFMSQLATDAGCNVCRSIYQQLTSIGKGGYHFGIVLAASMCHWVFVRSVHTSHVEHISHQCSLKLPDTAWYGLSSRPLKVGLVHQLLCGYSCSVTSANYPSLVQMFTMLW